MYRFIILLNSRVTLRGERSKVILSLYKVWSNRHALIKTNKQTAKTTKNNKLKQQKTP